MGRVKFDRNKEKFFGFSREEAADLMKELNQAGAAQELLLVVS